MRPVADTDTSYGTFNGASPISCVSLLSPSGPPIKGAPAVRMVAVLYYELAKASQHKPPRRSIHRPCPLGSAA